MKISLESTAARPSLWIRRTVIAVAVEVGEEEGHALERLGRVAVGDVRARSRIRVACWALVVQTFRPFTTQRSPCFSARVWMREVSVPALGSVTPNAITVSPLAIRGRYFRFIASVPYLMSGVGGNT